MNDKTNQKIPVTVTNELQGQLLSEFFCLRSNIHIIHFERGVKQSEKRVQKTLKIMLDLYKEYLFEKERVKRPVTQLTSENHHTVINRFHKVAMSSYDEKRELLKDGVKTLAYENCKIGNKSDEQVY